VFGLGDVSGIDTQCFVKRNEGQPVAGQEFNTTQSRLTGKAQDLNPFLQGLTTWNFNHNGCQRMGKKTCLYLNYAGKQSEDYSEPRENVREKKNPYS